MNYFQFDSLSISVIWIAAAAAFFISAAVNRILGDEKVGDWYGNSFFFYFIIWKLSYIVFNLKLFLDNPFSIVYFNGGRKGHILALVVLSFYLLMFAAKKDPAIYKISARLYLLYFILYETVVRLLEKDYIEAASHFILLVGLLLQSVTKKHQRLYGQMLIVWMLLELLMLSLFDTILSLQALTFIWIGLIVFILNEKANKEERILE